MRYVEPFFHEIQINQINQNHQSFRNNSAEFGIFAYLFHNLVENFK